jgi:hypothetical protein
MVRTQMSTYSRLNRRGVSRRYMVGGGPVPKDQSIVNKRVTIWVSTIYHTSYIENRTLKHMVSTIYHTFVAIKTHLLPLVVKSEGPTRWPGLLVYYYLNYTRSVRTLYRLAVGARSLIIGVLRANGRQRGIVIR